MIEHKFPVIAHFGQQDEQGHYRTAYCEECKEQISVWHETDGSMDKYWDDCADHVLNIHQKSPVFAEK